jgi:hypothetical protein
LLLLQLTSEPHMSQGMMNLDYKVNYFSFSRLFHSMHSSSVDIYCSRSLLTEHSVITHANFHHVVSLFYNSIFYLSGKGF